MVPDSRLPPRYSRDRLVRLAISEGNGPLSWLLLRYNHSKLDKLPS